MKSQQVKTADGYPATISYNKPKGGTPGQYWVKVMEKHNPNPERPLTGCPFSSANEALTYATKQWNYQTHFLDKQKL